MRHIADREFEVPRGQGAVADCVEVAQSSHAGELLTHAMVVGELVGRALDIDGVPEDGVDDL